MNLDGQGDWRRPVLRSISFSPLNSLVLCLAASLAAGCATYHKANYVSVRDVKPAAELPESAVETRYAENFDAEIHALYAKGYELIGYAQFTSPLQPQFALRNALWAAQAYGATLVVVTPPSVKALNQYFYISTFWRAGKPDRFILGAYYDDAPAELLGIVGCEQNMVLVRAVPPGTAAERMGLRAGDLITFFDGKPVEDARMLDELLLKNAGRDAEIKFLRDEKGYTARGRLGAGAQQARAAPLDRNVGAGLNLTQGALSDELSASLGRKEGVFVGGVSYGSAACASDLRSGDLITAVDGAAIGDVKDARALLEKAQGRNVTVSVLNAGAKENVTLDRTPAFVARMETLKRLDIAEAGYDLPWTRSEGADYTWAALVSLTAQGVGVGYQNYVRQREQERIAQVAAYNQMQAYRPPATAILPTYGGRRERLANPDTPPGFYRSRRHGLVPIGYESGPRIVPIDLKWTGPSALQMYLGQLRGVTYGMGQTAKSWGHHYNLKDNNNYGHQDSRPYPGR